MALARGLHSSPYPMTHEESVDQKQLSKVPHTKLVYLCGANKRKATSLAWSRFKRMPISTILVCGHCDGRLKACRAASRSDMSSRMIASARSLRDSVQDAEIQGCIESKREGSYLRQTLIAALCCRFLSKPLLPADRIKLKGRLKRNHKVGLKWPGKHVRIGKRMDLSACLLCR